MKFLAFVLIALFSLTLFQGQTADPISISGNNVGDIVTVNAQANAVVTSNIEQNIVSIILGLLNQQAAVVAAGEAN